MFRLQEKREEVLLNITLAEQRGDLARIADLKYGALPEIEANLKDLQAKVCQRLCILFYNLCQQACEIA